MRELEKEERAALTGLRADLDRVFGNRLEALVAYGLDARAGEEPLHALALVERLTFDDLAACARLADGWQRRGLDVPLLLERAEFLRTLDVFPLEYGAIVARHVLIAGRDPFAGVSVPVEYVRRAVELHAKSLLIHLREGYLESGGDAAAVGRLIAASAPALRAVVLNAGRLAGAAETDDVPALAERQLGVPAATVRDVLSASRASSIADPDALFARYLDAAERLWEYVDQWR